MPAQLKAHVALNGMLVPVVPALADSVGPRGSAVLAVIIAVDLDADDLAAVMLAYLTAFGELNELVSDEAALASVADQLVNDGFGCDLTRARDALTDSADLGAAWCKLRAANLLSSLTAAAAVPARPGAGTASRAVPARTGGPGSVGLELAGASA